MICLLHHRHTRQSHSCDQLLRPLTNFHDPLPFCALNAPLSKPAVLQECVCRRFGVDVEGREVVYDDVVDALAITAPITNIQQVHAQPSQTHRPSQIRTYHARPLALGFDPGSRKLKMKTKRQLERVLLWLCGKSDGSVWCLCCGCAGAGGGGGGELVHRGEDLQGTDNQI